MRHANEIKRVKDQEKRDALLNEAIQNQLSVEDIRTRIKGDKVEAHHQTNPLQIKLIEVLKKVKRTDDVWSCSERRVRLEDILATLEQLLKSQ